MEYSDHLHLITQHIQKKLKWVQFMGSPCVKIRKVSKYLEFFSFFFENQKEFSWLLPKNLLQYYHWLFWIRNANQTWDRDSDLHFNGLSAEVPTLPLPQSRSILNITVRETGFSIISPTDGVLRYMFLFYAKQFRRYNITSRKKPNTKTNNYTPVS